MSKDPLVISISIPQYNRIDYLLKSLETISQQTYDHLEIVISDDCSTDETEYEIGKLAGSYRYPVVYKKNERNLGYDRNYRQSLELATGDYCFVLGNDDTLAYPEVMEELVTFLATNDLPDLGACNFREQGDNDAVYKRAATTGVIGAGYPVALKYYSCFSFVAGLIYKRTTFLKYNSAAYDGSIYAQMYLGCLMISSGAIFFTIESSLVIKDILIDGSRPNNYRDTLARSWKDYRVRDGGLPSVINVLISAFRDAGVLSQDIIFRIYRKIYLVTYPHWLMDYRVQKAFPEAFGLSRGVKPWTTPGYVLLTPANKMRINLIYQVSTVAGLTVPVVVFKKLRVKLYRLVKKGFN